MSAMKDSHSLYSKENTAFILLAGQSVFELGATDWRIIPLHAALGS